MPVADPHDAIATPVDPDATPETPSAYLAVELSESDRTALEAWVHLHLTQITTEMQPILARFQQEVDQLEGNMPGANYPYSGAFRVNAPVTRRKVRDIANRIKQAYLESNPVWGIDLDDPRLFELATKLEKALDTALDHELDEEDDLSQALFEATAHGAGFLMPCWLYHEERVRRVQSWPGFDEDAAQFGRTEDDLRAALQGLFDFERDYPNWREEPELRRLHGLLRRGQDVTREITATVAVQNHPDFQHIPAKQVRVYPTVEGYEGLRTTPLYGFVSTATRFELEELQRTGAIDEDALTRLAPEAPSSTRGDDDARSQTEAFEVFQGTIRYRLAGDEDPVRYKVWYAVKEQVLLRMRFYPWWYHEADLIPCYVRMEEPGFFKRGIAFDVVDEHTVINAILNMYLNAIDMANSMRWRAKWRSRAYAHLVSGRHSPHLPVPYEDNENEVSSLSTPVNHLGAIVTGLEVMRRQSDEATGTTSLQSGRESPTDPTAPGVKTIALLQQVQPNERDILRSLEPAIRQMGRWTLWLYFQGLKLGWIEVLPGGLQVPPDFLLEVADRLHPRAVLFEFDRQGRFNRNVGLLQLTHAILAGTRPDVILKMLRVTISQADSQWARLVDTLDLERPQPVPAPGAGEMPTTALPPVNGTAGTPVEQLVNRLGATAGRAA